MYRCWQTSSYQQPLKEPTWMASLPTRKNRRLTSFAPNQVQKIEAVAFDMDGLLLNTEDLYEEVGATLLLRRGKPYRDEVRRKMIGLPAPQAFGLLIEEEELEDDWMTLQRETDEIFEGLLDERLEKLPGVDALLDELDKRGLPRCVATSSTPSFANKVLSLSGVIERLDFVLTASEVGRGKPNPDIYLEAAKRMQVMPSQMLVLEDSENGTKAGVASGAIVVSVPNKHTEHGSFVGSLFQARGLVDPRIYQLLDHPG